MTSRRPLPLISLCTLALLGAALVGCSSAPSPTPTPTPLFASEEEAFAAAEATYRAYVGALNSVDMANPQTFEPVFATLTGSAVASTKKTFSEFHSQNFHLTGETSFDSFEGVSADLEQGQLIVLLCLDVSQVDLRNAEGDSLITPDRVDRQPMQVVFEHDEATGTQRIASMKSDGGQTCSR